MDKRYTVFVSSTYNDLKEQRDAVIQTIMRAGHIPLGMEAFGAANASQWSVITKTIDASDYYVLLIARRYGSINEETGLGFTEMEYDYALKKGVPCLVFQLDESASWPGGSVTDNEPKMLKKLRNFRRKSSNNRMIVFWNDKSALPYQVMTALSNAFSDDHRDGWVRPKEMPSADVAAELARLSRENADLKAENAALKSVVSESTAKLECLFLDQNGLSLGSDLIFKKHDVEQVISNVQSNYRTSIGFLLQKFNSSYNGSKYVENSNSDGLGANVYEKFPISPDYIDNIRRKLNDLGYDFSESDVFLDDLFTEYMIPGINGFNSPSRGKHLASYEILLELDAKLQVMEEEIKNDVFHNDHISIVIGVRNDGTEPAPDLTVKILDDRKKIGYFTEIDKYINNPKYIEKIEGDIALVAPKDTRGAIGFAVNIKGLDNINYTVRLVGRNLKDALEFNLSLTIDRTSE